MPKRNVDTGRWAEPWFEALTFYEKSLYNYLEQCEPAKPGGVYYITFKRIGHDLALPEAQIDKTIRNLEPYVLYDRRVELVMIRKFIRHQRNSDSWVLSAIKSLNEIQHPFFIKEIAKEYEILFSRIAKTLDNNSHRDAGIFMHEYQRLRTACTHSPDRLLTAPDSDTDTDLTLSFINSKGVNSISEDQQPYEPAERGDPYEDAFATLWEMYPRKNGKLIGKADTELEFRKVKTEDIPLVLAAVKHYAQSKRAQEGWGIRDPRYFFRKHGESTPYWREWIEPEKQEVNSGQRLKEPGYDEIPEK